MTNKTFKVSGNYFYRQGTYPFVKTVSAENETAANEKVYCLMGSNHKLKRGEMEVTSVEICQSSQAVKPSSPHESKTEKPQTSNLKPQTSQLQPTQSNDK